MLIIGCANQQPVAKANQRPAHSNSIVKQQSSDSLRATDAEPSAPSTIMPADIPIASGLTDAPINVLKVSLSGEQKSTPLLTLENAILYGLAQTPDLRALRQAEGVSLSALGVAKTYPFNPYVQLQVLPLDQRANGTQGLVNHYVLLMQTLQLPRKQEYREEAARHALSTVRWNIVQAELLNVSQTQRLYFAAVYQRDVLDLAKAAAQIQRQLFEINTNQHELGRLPDDDWAVAQVELIGREQQSRLNQALYLTAVRDLHRHIGAPLDLPIEPDGDMDSWSFDPIIRSAKIIEDSLQADSVAEIAADLARGRPDVMAAAADVGTVVASENLANANRIPDLQIGPYYQESDSGTRFLGFRAQAEIPVWNNGQPLLKQRQAEVRQRRVVYDELNSRARLEAQAAIERYEYARLIIRHEEREKIGEMIASLDAKLKTAELQESDRIRFLKLQLTLVSALRPHLDNLNELAQAAATMVSSAAIPVETFVHRDPQESYDPPLARH